MQKREKRQKRERLPFAPQFKAKVVDLCRARDRSPGARDLDLAENAVRASGLLTSSSQLSYESGIFCPGLKSTSP